MKKVKIAGLLTAGAFFLTIGTFVFAAKQSVANPVLARSDSPWNVLAYGGKGEMHGAPICHPLGYFSQSPLPLDFDDDFYGEKSSNLTTQADVTLLGIMSGRKIYEVKQTVRRHDTANTSGPDTSVPPTMKILLVERSPGQFCDIYQNQYAYDPTSETDEALILNIKGRQFLKTYETDRRTWFLEYWAVTRQGPARLNLDALYKSIQSVLPSGARPIYGPLDLTDPNLKVDVQTADRRPIGTLDVELAIEGNKLVIVNKNWKVD